MRTDLLSGITATREVVDGEWVGKRMHNTKWCGFSTVSQTAIAASLTSTCISLESKIGQGMRT
jgi:hypothetical protein